MRFDRNPPSFFCFDAREISRLVSRRSSVTYAGTFPRSSLDKTRPFHPPLRKNAFLSTSSPRFAAYAAHGASPNLCCVRPPSSPSGAFFLPRTLSSNQLTRHRFFVHTVPLPHRIRSTAQIFWKRPVSPQILDTAHKSLRFSNVILYHPGHYENDRNAEPYGMQTNRTIGLSKGIRSIRCNRKEFFPMKGIAPMSITTLATTFIHFCRHLP